MHPEAGLRIEALGGVEIDAIAAGILDGSIADFSDRGAPFAHDDEVGLEALGLEAVDRLGVAVHHPAEPSLKKGIHVGIAQGRPSGVRPHAGPGWQEPSSFRIIAEEAVTRIAEIATETVWTTRLAAPGGSIDEPNAHVSLGRVGIEAFDQAVAARLGMARTVRGD